MPTTNEPIETPVAPEATLLLKSLLARLDADARLERPRFLGVVSDAERQALRQLLDHAERQSRDSTEDTAKPSPPKVTPPVRVSPGVELNTAVLRLSESPAPDWRLCLDFGTAKSKAFAATTDEQEPERLELPIGKADEDLDQSVYAVSSSVWIGDDGRLFAGSAAVRSGMEYDNSSATNRRRLDSLKQEISQVSHDGSVSRILPPEVDPTSTLTFRDVLTFYLAYLTDLATTELEHDARIGTRYVQRRFTAPRWADEQRQWAGDLIGSSLANGQLLADTFHGDWGKGIPVDVIKHAVESAGDYKAQLEWLLEPGMKAGMLEPLAAASERLWNDSEAREVMLVVDVGAGTTDFSLFLARQSSDQEFHRAWPIEPGSKTIRQAGDTLDSLLLAEIMRKANLGGDRGLLERVRADLQLRNLRRLKEALFETGEITVDNLVNDATVTLARDEFLKSEGVKNFETLISRTIQELLDEVHASWAKAENITFVLTGGGCKLPMVRSLVDKEWKIGGTTLRCRLAVDVPDRMAASYSDEFIRDYPILAVAMGGALPMRLDERKSQKEWYGGTKPPGPLESFPARGA